ncbi:hypothetical protein MBLNU230_g5578t1 [Neophaeotheca triangularis]
MRPSTSLSLSLFSLTSLVSAFPRITSPAPGGRVAAGPIDVEWEDNGDTPRLADLGDYTWHLIVGGNEGAEQKPLADGPGSTPIASGSTEVEIDPGLSETVRNGFYFKMVCTAIDGGTVTVYSDRFTITDMTGVLEPEFADAVEGLGTKGPENVNTVGADPINDGDADGGDGDDDEPEASLFKVPFAEQTGSTRYCPMQPIAPTKITAKKASRMHPTSSYSVATTWLPMPKIATTITQKQTFTVKSIENTVPPISVATDDLDRFLARWKD